MMKSIQLMGISAALVAGAANAGPLAMRKVESMTTTVSYSRAAAQTPEGAAELYGKLKSAAENACGRMVSYHWRYADQFRICVSAALDEAVRDVDMPQVSLLHN